MTETGIKDFLSLFPENLMQLSVEEQQVSLLLYKLLVKGRPVTYKDVADELGVEIIEINEL